MSEEKITFSFENETDESFGIETGTYKNGNKIKKVPLLGGKTAVVRELTGKDLKKVDLLLDGKPENYMMIMMALATKIDEEEKVFEDYELMKAKDFNKIKLAVSSLNF